MAFDDNNKTIVAMVEYSLYRSIFSTFLHFECFLAIWLGKKREENHSFQITTGSSFTLVAAANPSPKPDWEARVQENSQPFILDVNSFNYERSVCRSELSGKLFLLSGQTFVGESAGKPVVPATQGRKKWMKHVLGYIALSGSQVEAPRRGQTVGRDLTDGTQVVLVEGFACFYNLACLRSISVQWVFARVRAADDPSQAPPERGLPSATVRRREGGGT